MTHISPVSQPNINYFLSFDRQIVENAGTSSGIRISLFKMSKGNSKILMLYVSGFPNT